MNILTSGPEIGSQMRGFAKLKVCVSHREPAADVSNEEEGVMLEIAHHGVAAAQLCGPTVPLMVVTDAAVPHHGEDEGEDPLMATGGENTEMRRKARFELVSVFWVIFTFDCAMQSEEASGLNCMFFFCQS